MKKNLIMSTNWFALVVLNACQSYYADPELKSVPTLKDEPRQASWQKKHSAILLDADKNKNLYQIKVLGQGPNECTLHDLRNLLFVMAMLKEKPTQFAAEYQRMVNKDLFESTPFVNECSRGF